MLSKFKLISYNLLITFYIIKPHWILDTTCDDTKLINNNKKDLSIETRVEKSNKNNWMQFECENIDWNIGLRLIGDKLIKQSN